MPGVWSEAIPGHLTSSGGRRLLQAGRGGTGLELGRALRPVLLVSHEEVDLGSVHCALCCQSDINSFTPPFPPPRSLGPMPSGKLNKLRADVEAVRELLALGK